MLITESQLGTGFSRSGMSLLENMSYLTEEESQYHAAMVPIVENARIGANVVALEDIMKFSESNGIEDLGYALSCVCEASGIEANTIAFSVQEESIILGEEAAYLAKDIMNEGINIFAVPTSQNDSLAFLAEMAIDDIFEYNDSSLLEAFVNGDWDMFLLEAKFGSFDDVKARVGDLEKQINKKGANSYDVEKAKKEVEFLKKKYPDEKAFNARSEKAKSIMSNRANREVNRRYARWEEDKAEGLTDQDWHAYDKERRGPGTTVNTSGQVMKGVSEEKAKKAADAVAAIEKAANASNDKNFIARQIAKLNTWAKNMQEKMAAAEGDGKVKAFFKAVAEKIAKAIAFLTKKLHNLVPGHGENIA